MRKNVTRIIILILTVILVYKIIDIYAAYKSMVKVNTNTNVKPWVIYINEKDITGVIEKSFGINEIIYKSEDVKEGKIAPGANFEIPIKIDATKMLGMDIRYDISIEEVVIDENKLDINIKDVLEKNTNSNLIKTGENTYTGIITKNNIEQSIIHSLSINLIWENNEVNNEKDTELGMITDDDLRKTQIEVVVKVSQYGNEELKEYTEGSIDG